MNPVLELALDHPASFAGLVLTIACLACALLSCASLSLQEWQDGRRHKARRARIRARFSRYRARY
jgi:hypothetical protein